MIFLMASTDPFLYHQNQPRSDNAFTAPNPAEGDLHLKVPTYAIVR